MPYTRSTFLGLSVLDINATTGWGEQASTLSVRLALDPFNGDEVLAPEPGQPIYFSLGNFLFFGLLQRFEQVNDFGGYPTYEAVCVDPRELLRGVSLIVNQYAGITSGTPNLVNVYGYFESLFGFGAAFATDAGMPWNRVVQGMNALMTSPIQTPYGGPIRYKGVAYSLDLSSLPIPPDYYRIGGSGVEVNLMDAIIQLCQDYGLDFYVELVGFQIKVTAVNRAAQPPLGTIALAASPARGDVLNSRYGIEDAQGQIKSVFLIGGNKEEMFSSSTIYSFWGYDLNNQPIVGVPGSFRGLLKVEGRVQPPGATEPDMLEASAYGVEVVGQVQPPEGTSAFKSYYLATEWITLNASPVADILGKTFYYTNLLELRAAMSSISVWTHYMLTYRRALAQILFGILNVEVITEALQGQPVLNADNVLDFDAKVSKMATDAASQSEFTIRRQRLFAFLRQVANEYYGKRFLIPLPGVSVKVDATAAGIAPALIDAYSDYVQYSHEMSDRAYSPTAPLALPDGYADLFADTQRRWEPYVFIADSQADLMGVGPTDYVVGNGGVYMKCQVAREMVFIGNTPHALITLAAPLYDRPTQGVLDMAAVQAVFQIESDVRARQMIKHVHTQVALHPAAVYPNLATVPIKSNVATYGPWFIIGGQGRVQVQQDQTLVPWNYGGLSYLNVAAAARLDGAASNLSVIESGGTERAGTPDCSLGQALLAGGPQVTGITINYSARGGVTTSYRWQTYTPRFGAMSRIWAERMREIRQKTADLGRTLRQTLRENVTTSFTINSAKRGAITNKILAWEIKNREKQERKETPHDCLYYTSVLDGDSGRTLPQAESVDLLEGLAQVGFEDGEEEHWQRTAMMSWTGLIRGITITSQETYPAYYLPTYCTTPSGSFAGGVHGGNLNPFASGNDIHGYLWGDSYAGFNAYRRAGEITDPVKVIGLRAPLVLAGWGWDLQGKPTPGIGNAFIPDHRNRSEYWQAGAVDLLWDPWRKVWTPHDLLHGVVEYGVEPFGWGYLTIYNASGSTGETVVVWDTFGSTIASGTRVDAGWMMMAHRWQIVHEPTPSSVGLPDGPIWSVLVQQSGNPPTAEWLQGGHITYPAVGDPSYYGVLFFDKLRGQDKLVWTDEPYLENIFIGNRGFGSSGAIASIRFNSMDSPSGAGFEGFCRLVSPFGSGQNLSLRLPGYAPENATGYLLGLYRSDPIINNVGYELGFFNPESLKPSGLVVQNQDGSVQVSGVLTIQFPHEDGFAVSEVAPTVARVNYVPSGYTGITTVVSNVMCSGSSLLVTTETYTWIKGMLSGVT